MLNVFSQQSFLDALSAVRRGESYWQLDLSNLLPDQRLYLLAEYAVQVGQYSLIEAHIVSRKDELSSQMIALVRTYRNLFTDPQTAYGSVLALLSNDESTVSADPALLERLIFWQAHLELLLGKPISKEKIRSTLVKPVLKSLWRAELLAIRALGYYFLNDLKAAIHAHGECEHEIALNRNTFIALFNSTMACRTTLCERDSLSFHHYLNRLEQALSVKNDCRYRLRYLGYRALAYEQLGESDRADFYWNLANAEMKASESELEKFHCHLAQGIALALRGRESEAGQRLELARHSLELAGNPQKFRDEWVLAKGLVQLAAARLNRLPLAVQWDYFRDAMKWFANAVDSGLSSSSATRAGQELIDAWVHGADFNQGALSRSFVIDLILGYDDRGVIGAQKDRFRYVSRLVDRVDTVLNAEEDQFSECLRTAVSEVTGLEVVIENGLIQAAKVHSELAHDPELRSVLKVANQWLLFHDSKSRLARISSELSAERKFRQLAEQVEHDLRSPLTSIKMVLGSLLNIDADVREVLTVSVSRISEIVRDISAKSAGSNSQRSAVVYNKLSEDGWLSDAMKVLVMQKKLEHPQVEWRCDLEIGYEDGVNFGVKGFSEERISGLLRVISNLANNSANASSENVCIRIKDETTNAGNFLLVEVEDDGTGMDQQILNRVGSRGFTTRPAEGSGLGLFHAVEFAQSLNGELSIESSPGRGTLIRMRCPCEIS